MVKINVDAVSAFGVKVDGKWINFSKGFKIPENVSRNNSYDIELDSKGKINKIVPVGGNLPNTKEPALDNDVFRRREILKGQCLNLMFENLSNNPRSPAFNLCDVKDRNLLYEQTATLFAELQNAGYLRW